jgi:hypothetical protein
MAQTFSIYLLWLSAIFDPVGSIFGIRYIALLVVIFVLINKAIFGLKIVSSKSLYAKYALLFCFFLPIYGSFITLFRGGFEGSSFIDTSYFASAVYYATTLSFLQQGNIRTSIRAFLLSARLLCFFIISFALLIMLTLSTDFLYFFVEHGVAYLGQRQYGGVSFYYIYFVASPILIILLAHDSWRVLERPSFFNLFFFVIAFFALFLSGTRFSMISAVATFPLALYFKCRSFLSRSMLAIAIVISIGCIFIYLNDVVGGMLSFAEQSNNVKLSYFEWYFRIFNDPFSLLFGQGFNAHEWSYETSMLIIGQASKTELTYLELIRVFGLFGASFFFFGMSYFFTFYGKILPENRWIFLGMALYLLASSVNPYLFSSNGMLVLGLAATIISLRHKSDPNYIR